MAAQPQLKVNELLVQLEQLAAQDQPDEFSLRRIEGEANRMLNSDAAMAYMLRGIICCIRGDVDGMRNNHENSLKLRDDAILRSNYANSLDYLHLMADAIAQFEQMLRLYPSVSVLSNLVSCAIKSGRPQSAINYGDQLTKLDPSAKDNVELVNKMSTASLMLKSGLNDQAISAINDIAFNVAGNFGAKIIGVEHWLDEYSLDEPSVIALMHTTYPNIVDLNFALADHFAQANTEELRSGRYHLSFTGRA